MPKMSNVNPIFWENKKWYELVSAVFAWRVLRLNGSGFIFFDEKYKKK